MAPNPAACSRSGRDGFIIVAVLWILGALATLAAVYAIYVGRAAVSVAANDDPVRAEALVSAATELTVYRLAGVAADKRPTQGAFDFRLGRAKVAVTFRSEAARIDLNAAPKELLAGLFGVLGAATDEATEYAARVIGWRTAPRGENFDPEASLYRAAGLSYGPREAPFAHTDELWLVLGLPPALVERALSFVTVFSGRAEVDVLDAAPEVVAALPGMTPERLNEFLAQRRRATLAAPEFLQLLGPSQASTTTDGGRATRLGVRVDLISGRRLTSEVVILVVDDGDQPYQVLSWRDDIDPTGTLR